MRKIDLGTLPVLWEEEHLRHLASEVDVRAGDPPSSRSVGSANHTSAAGPTPPNKERAFAWMAGRIGWELRLNELRSIHDGLLGGHLVA
jgi:hypothetical protein